MKGMLNVALISAISLLTIIGTLSFSLAYKSNAVVKGIQERNIKESVNQFKILEKGLEQSASYSAYQAFYNTLKHGTYRNDGNGVAGKCNTDSIQKFPTNLPYLKIYDSICDEIPAGIENRIIKQVEKEQIQVFTEYISSIKENYKIDIPRYASKIISIDNEHISFNLDSNEKLTFENANMKVSDNFVISKIEKLPLKRLIDTVSKFLEKDYVKDAIVSSEKSMSNVKLDAAKIKKSEWNNANKLNDGELGGTCKNTEFKICVDPSIVKNFDYVYPKKADFLTQECENVFRLKTIQNTNSISINVPGSTLSVETNQNMIDSNVDTTDESTCATSYQGDSASCDCIKLVCGVNSPVIVGDEKRFRTIEEHEAGSDMKCAPCVGIISGKTFGESFDTCEQYKLKVCQEGTEQNGECIVTKSIECPSTGSSCSLANYDEDKDLCYYNQGCPKRTGCPSSGLYSYDSSEYCELEGGNNGIYKASPTCPGGFTFDPAKDECIKTIPKQCPSGTEEFGSTGRCYAATKTDPTCSLHKTLYTKTCGFNYQANVAALVKVKDGERYPVYDEADKKTSSRNLEFDFMSLSKN